MTNVLLDYLIIALGPKLSQEANLAWKKLLDTLVDVVTEEQNRIAKENVKQKEINDKQKNENNKQKEENDKQKDGNVNQGGGGLLQNTMVGWYSGEGWMS